MLGLEVLGVAVIAILLLVLLARFIDRVRGLDPNEKWSGWYRGKSANAGKKLYSGSDFESMDDHGNREQDGGL